MARDLPHRPRLVRLTLASDTRSARFVESAPAEIFFLLSAAAQYTGAVVAVRLFDDASPPTIALFRVLSAAGLLMLFSLRSNHAPWTRHDLYAAASFGIATAMMNLTFYLAIDRLPLGKSVTIEFIGPIAVAALRTKTARNTVALLLAAGGVVVLGGVEIADEPLGLFFLLIASAMWAGYIVLGSRVAQTDRGVNGLGVGLVFGALVIAPFGVGDAGTVLTTPWLLAACVLVGASSSAIGYGIDQAVMRRIPIRRFSVMLSLLPVTAAVFGLLFLDQTPTRTDLFGMMLVLVGVAIQERDVIDRRPEVAETP